MGVTYLFRCPKCGKILEREFPMGEAPDAIRSDCDKTGKARVKCRRVYPSVPIHGLRKL